MIEMIVRHGEIEISYSDMDDYPGFKCTVVFDSRMCIISYLGDEKRLPYLVMKGIEKYLEYLIAEYLSRDLPKRDNSSESIEEYARHLYSYTWIRTIPWIRLNFRTQAVFLRRARAWLTQP